MSKKMKGDSIDPSTYGAYGDPKARFKHQVLMQDYRELQKVKFPFGFSSCLLKI